MGKLSVQSLGSGGVILDVNPLDPAIPDNALVLAQNATHDSTLGRTNAIHKRAGLKRFNLVAAAGAITGGIMVPVAGTGGAPAETGSGVTGGSTGSGDGTGGAGATSDGAAAATTQPGASAFGGGSDGSGTIFSGRRLLMIGRLDNTAGSNVGGAGWFVTSKQFADVSLSGVTTPGPPCASDSYPGATPFYNHYGRPFAILKIDGVTWLYYAATHGNLTVASAAPIRRTNGKDDQLVATIPLTPYVTNSDRRCTILWMQALPANTLINDDLYRQGGGAIAICVKDKFNGQATAGSMGRIFYLSAFGSSHSLVEVNTGTSVKQAPVEYDQLPYCLDGAMPVAGWPYPRIFWGEYLDGAVGVGASIYCAEPWLDKATGGSNSGYWSSTLDTTFATGDGTIVSCMENYNGRIFCATSVNTSGTPTLGNIYSRRPDSPAGSTGTDGWVGVSHTELNSETPANGNGYLSMAKFGTDLYVSWYGGDPGHGGTGHGRILKITAADPYSFETNPNGYLSTGFTVTTVLSDAVPYWLFVDDGVLYAIAVDELSGAFTMTAKYSTDGTTWSADQSTKIPNQGHVARAIPILCGFEQT